MRQLASFNAVLRGHLLSKLSQLKQDAYQAGKKRDWGLAVSIYEKILEIDKSNPMVINEMGDLCLKAGETPRAIRHFLSAASRYRTTGLLNNAVAIYKKILRYDSENQNAHWYLAETRASQGLLVEGEDHAVHFLDGSDEVAGDIKEIFLKRCTQCFELYSCSRPVMEKLLPIFRSWNLNLEAARTNSLLACFTHEEGEVDVARQAMEDIRARNPEVCNYPEFQKLQKLLDPEAATAARRSADFNSISLDSSEPGTGDEEETLTIAPPAAEVESGPGSGPESGPAVEPESGSEPEAAPAQAPVFDADPFGVSSPEEGSEPASEPESGSPSGPEPETDEDGMIEIPAGNAGEDSSFASVAIEIQEAVESADPVEGGEADEDGCFDLGADGDSASFDDLVAQAASGIGDEEESEADVSSREIETGAGSAEAAEAEQKVDLLAQILSDEGSSKQDHEDSQLAAITSDIGAQVGGGEQDPASLYEMGMVYLDMGLFDQAVESFEKAAQDDDYVLRGLEMAGITLLKAQRPGDAVRSLQRGREIARPGTREHLGLSYHLAQAQEQSGREDAALDLYQEICSVDPGFLDVKSRLAELSGV